MSAAPHSGSRQHERDIASIERQHPNLFTGANEGTCIVELRNLQTWQPDFLPSLTTSPC